MDPANQPFEVIDVIVIGSLGLPSPVPLELSLPAAATFVTTFRPAVTVPMAREVLLQSGDED